jgi:putative flippase GtrA
MQMGARGFRGIAHHDALRQRRCISSPVRQFHWGRIHFCNRPLRLTDRVGSDCERSGSAASAAGALLGAWINYTLNYHFTFRSSKRHREAALKFAAIAVVGILLNTVFMWVGIELIGAHYLLSQIVTTGLVLICSFAGNRYWTFQSAEPRE